MEKINLGSILKAPSKALIAMTNFQINGSDDLKMLIDPALVSAVSAAKP